MGLGAKNSQNFSHVSEYKLLCSQVKSLNLCIHFFPLAMHRKLESQHKRLWGPLAINCRGFPQPAICAAR